MDIPSQMSLNSSLLLKMTKVPNKIKIPVLIEKGKFASNLDTIRDILAHYEGKYVDVVFQKRKNTRSKSQNRYYWALIVEVCKRCIRNEWGEIWSSEDVHLLLKENFNFIEKYNEETGVVIRMSKSTTENSTNEQEEYHEKCRNFVAEFFNTRIPLPNEEIEIND